MFRITSAFTAILLAVVILGCGDKDNPIQPPAPNPVGDWNYTVTFNYEGTNLAAAIQCAVAANNTYQVNGYITDGSNTITIGQEQGTWGLSGSTVTFTPSTCREYDNSTHQLEIITCSGPSNFVLNSGNTQMTDATITMVKQ